MKLWIVRRRAPLLRGARKVYIDRSVAMAATAEDAIALVKNESSIDTSTRDGAQYAAMYLSGKWTADEIEAPCTFDFGSVTVDPTKEEVAERKKRMDLADRRRADRKSTPNEDAK